ncbi:hypothetical protein LUZ63_011936 [Rhynchospora breviuscula]|uniref:Mediator of RNA polymerase II transcription subunit 33A n=1 Tax=Rhynchospora breviuscula TaxID=2022672 RepID=A0A9Q0CJY7_9POAL|nr:hypothetical protein LUZ63_011936 [Rhynchospora breviuscula]
MAAPSPLETSPVVSATSDLERRVMATVMTSETRGDPPWLCAVKVAQCCGNEESNSPGFRSVFPNADLALIMVSNLCFSNNTPYMWKLLEQSMATKLVYPLHVLALLTFRVIQNRREQPQTYRLYLELMRRYAVSFSLREAGPHKEKIIKSIDDTLRLSNTYRFENWNLGMAVVLFLVSTMSSLLDCVLQDRGLLVASQYQHVNEGFQSMDIDVDSKLSKNRCKHLELLRQNNAFIALEVLENMCSSKCIQVSLRLVNFNMSETFKSLLQRLEVLQARCTSPESLLPINNLLERLFSHVKDAINSDYRLKRWDLLGHVFGTGLADSPLSYLIGNGKTCCWIPFDILMENVMDGKTFCPASSFEILTGLTKTLQIVNQASWQETFQALWISALQLVQKARELKGGPLLQIESRLSMLLSIVPLSIAPILREENYAASEGISAACRKQSLVACLQSLTQYSSLLRPPQPVVSAANDAAEKAARVVRNVKMASSNVMMHHKYSTNAVGNLLHLMVESCIARDLIDTSAYFWPDYVVPCNVAEVPDSSLIQYCPWSNFMQGAPLTMSLQNALTNIPAPSVTELKKLNHLALHGSDEERSASSKILCGASLDQGWCIQEHVVHIAVKLLSPQLTLGSPRTGDANFYLSHMHMLATLLSCLSHDCVIHILSLYGLVPDVVAALMPLCEAFGSFPPPSPNQSSTGEEVSPYSVFSFAFLFLLRLCKNNGPDKEFYTTSCGGPVRPDIKLDFFLLTRNSRIQKNTALSNRYYVNNVADPFHDLRCHPVYVDSFPNLRAWYFERQVYLTSNLSDKCNSSRKHQVANDMLIFICRNMNINDNWLVSSSNSSTITHGSSSTFCSSASGSNSGSSERISGDEIQGLPHYPAWELLEAAPLVLDAIFNACAYGPISSRDLTIGLKGLVDFLPVSVAAIISYFMAEITRGTWKSVPLNGIDWPTPAEALNSFHLEVKEVLERVSVHVQNWYPQDVEPMLPLPLAALLSLSITFKLDKNSEYIYSVIGRALGNYLLNCPWPIMLTICALWIQKARMWHDYIVLLGARSHFTNDKDAVRQLLSSCFKSFLDAGSMVSNFTTSSNGVVDLLGESVCGRLAVRPGILFLNTCHLFRGSPRYFSDMICKLVVEWTCKLADEWTSGGPKQLKFGQMSLAATICAVRRVAILGASLLCMAGRSSLVQYLFEETAPTFLLSMDEERFKQTSWISSMLVGYAISYLLFFSAAIVWGVQAGTGPDKFRGSDMSPYAIKNHLSFIAKVTEGNIALRCDPALWEAHVSSFVGLIVRLAPSWVPHTKLDALKKISSSLRRWHEQDLSLSLLELGGISAIEDALESLS